MKELSELNISGNKLTGEIPVELFNARKLQIIYLRENEISGNIPHEIVNLSNLEILHIFSNKLSGTIPIEIGELKKLENIWLHNNFLTGTIPHELGQLKYLSDLSLSYNQLYGEIPIEIGNLLKLKNLYIDNNNLSGSLPKELGNLFNLKELYLNNNKLKGEIPIELTKLTNLLEKKLNLCSNSFYSNNNYLISFLNNKHIDGDWQSCQNRSDEIKDTDNDGVIDQWDNCPKTPINSCVNNRGCSCEHSIIDEKGTVEKGKWKTYYANIDNSHSNIIVKIQNLTEDVDLYVKKSNKPDFDNYDCRPYKGGKRDEICNLSNSGDNLWYFCIYGYKTGDFTISVKTKR